MLERGELRGGGVGLGSLLKWGLRGTVELCFKMRPWKVFEFD